MATTYYYYLIIAPEDGWVLAKQKLTSKSPNGPSGGWYEVSKEIYDEAVIDEMVYYPETGTLGPIPFHITKVASSTQINYPTENSDLCLQDWMDDVDSALANVGACKIGSYTGNGEATRTIEVGFTPSAVLVMRNDSVMSDTSNIISGLATASSPVKTSGGLDAIAVTENGFTVGRGTGYTTNVTTKVYNYIAFK